MAPKDDKAVRANDHDGKTWDPEAGPKNKDTGKPEGDYVPDGSIAFEVTKPFNPSQLDAELTEGHNWRNPAGLEIDGDPATASEEAPVIVRIVRGEDANTNTVKRIINDHEPEPEYEPTEANTLEELAAAVVERDLTESEQQRALRLLLEQAVASQTPTE